LCLFTMARLLLIPICILSLSCTCEGLHSSKMN
jgi:hypothetical protein